MTEVPAKVAEPATAVPPTDDRARRRRGRLIDLAWAIGTGFVAMALAGIWLQVWDAHLHVPLWYHGDANFSLLMTKTVMQNGWVGVDHNLGYPFGSALYDNAVIYGDSFHLFLIKILALGSSDPVAVMNVFFFGTFFLVALTCQTTLRDLGFSHAVAAVPAVLYALQPYHFFRNENHLFLAAYYSVPLGGWLVLRALRGMPLFTRRAAGAGRITGWLSGRTLATLAACFVVGTAELYYAAFTLLLIVPLAFLGAVAARDLRRLIGPSAVVVAIVGSTVLVQLPPILWHANHGSNTDVAKRFAHESEEYALSLTNLVVPLPGHPIKAISDLGSTYYSDAQVPKTEVIDGALGTWLTFGFLAVILLAGAAAFGRQLMGQARLAADAGLATGLAFIFGTVGGTGAIFGYYVSTQMRGWNRISTFIAYFAAIGLATLLAWGFERVRGTHVTTGGKALAIVALLVVLYTGYRDQTRPGFRPEYASNFAAWRSDARFISAVERTLPGNAALLQLPRMGFPEFGRVNEIADYDELKGYIHSDRLRWSYGAIKGRQPDDWSSNLSQMPLEQGIPAAIAIGFRGVVVDVGGYEDGGAAINAQLSRITGGKPAVVSEDGRLVFYDLTAMVRKAAALPAVIRRGAAQTLLQTQVRVVLADGFYPQESNAADTWNWASGKASLALTNSIGKLSRVALRFKLRTPGRNRGTVVLHLPDGTTKSISVAPRSVKTVRLNVAAPPGPSTLQLTTNGPPQKGDGADTRDLRMQVLDFGLDDSALTQITAALQP